MTWRGSRCSSKTENRSSGRCGRPWNLAASATAVALIVIASGLRLDAGMPVEKAPSSREPDAAKPTPAQVQTTAPDTSKPGETLSYNGRVTDKDTGRPIAGATVVIRRSVLPDPKTGENRIIEESRHQTDANGQYAFTIPPERKWPSRLYIELDVEHPDYAPQKGFGYALGMIRKNEKLGGRPFFEAVTLAPARRSRAGSRPPTASRRLGSKSWPSRRPTNCRKGPSKAGGSSRGAVRPTAIDRTHGGPRVVGHDVRPTLT